MWSEGVIGIPDAKDKEKYTKCHYWVKHYDEPSETYGINGGRISDGALHPAGESQLSIKPEYEYSGRLSQ